MNGDPKLTQQVVIGPDGMVSFPLLGDVTFGGLTVREATVNVTELLARDYLVDPKVDIQILEYKSRWVMVTGRSASPAAFLSGAGRSSRTSSRTPTGSRSARGRHHHLARRPWRKGRVELPVDRRKFERAESNPVLMSGDIVSVPRAPVCLRPR